MAPEAPPDFSGPAHDRQRIGPDDPSAPQQYSEGFENPLITIDRFGPIRYGQTIEVITRSDRMTLHGVDVTIRVNGHTVMDLSHSQGTEFLKRLETALRYKAHD